MIPFHAMLILRESMAALPGVRVSTNFTAKFSGMCDLPAAKGFQHAAFTV
jgi:hypothetical protein